jgi:hypothetical protein
MPNSKIVLDLFVFCGEYLLVVERDAEDQDVANCLSTIWDYFPEGQHPIERIKEISEELNFTINEIFLNTIGLVHYEKDSTHYMPLAFRIETNEMREPKSNDMNKNLKWVLFDDFLEAPNLYGQYKNLDLKKIYKKEQYFFKAQNDYYGNKNLEMEILSLE